MHSSETDFVKEKQSRPTITEAEISAIKPWLGHSQNLMDLYAAQLRYDETYRREWCEKAGLGFKLGELGYKSEAPIRPALVA